MVRDDVVAQLASLLPKELAESLVDEFMQIRQDVATNILGRSSPGKFVETFAQILQVLSNDREDYDIGSALRVEIVLTTVEQKTEIDKDLRICGARIARSMYALRNKRNISHKGEVETNIYDLRFLLHGAQWILSELVRQSSDIELDEAFRMVSQIQEPVLGLVEDFGEYQLVLKKLTITDEILIHLHCNYPDAIQVKDLYRPMSRCAKSSIRAGMKKLWDSRHVERSDDGRYKLTRLGVGEARKIRLKQI